MNLIDYLITLFDREDGPFILSFRILGVFRNHIAKIIHP